MVLNLITAAGTAYGFVKSAYELNVAVKNTQKAKQEKIEKSDVKSIQEDLKKILDCNEPNSNKETIEITKNLEHFKIYCKAIGVKDDFNITAGTGTGTGTGTITLDKDKVKEVQKALITFDESVRDGTTKKLFDVDVDGADYKIKTMGQQGINFSADPFGKARELFNNSFNKDAVKKAEEAVKKAEDAAEDAGNDGTKKAAEEENLKKAKEKLIAVSKPDELKNKRIADNVFMLLQDQEKKCIEAVQKANKDAPFEYKDAVTKELLSQPIKWYGKEASELQESILNEKMKLTYDSNEVISDITPSDLNSLQDGQKLSLDYDKFFKDGVTLSEKEKEYIKRNAKFITVKVANDEQLLNLIQKMNEINATDSNVIYRKNNINTTAHLNHINSLLGLLGKDTNPPKYTIDNKEDTDITLENIKDVKYDDLKPLDYIKIAAWLHNNKDTKLENKQKLFKQIVEHKKFDAIEKSFPEFMDKIFPLEIKRYKDWGREYETDAELTGLFNKFATNTTDIASNPFDGIKDYSKKAKTDIINQFLKSEKFITEAGENQFETLNTILKDDNLKAIPAIKEACEAKATEKGGKILKYLAKKLYSIETSAPLPLENYSEEAKVKFFKAFLEKNISDDQDKIIKLAKTKYFTNIPKIKTMIAEKAQEKDVKLYVSEKEKKIIRFKTKYKIKDLSKDKTNYINIIEYVANINNKHILANNNYNKNYAIAEAVFKEILGRDERPTNITGNELKIALNWIELNDSKTIEARFQPQTKSSSKPASKRIISDKNTKKGFLSRLNFLKSRTPLST